MNKKILAILMALLMVLMSSVAFAAGDGTIDATFDKLYTKHGDTAVAPAETFEFVVSAGSVKGASEGVAVPSADNIDIADAVFTADGSYVVNVDVNLAAFTEVGSYTYPVTEVDGKLASVTYDATMTVVVLVQFDQKTNAIVKAVYVKNENEDKGNAGVDVENDYYAGSFKFDKKVTGAYGDPNKYFTVTVTLKGEGDKTYEGVTMVANGGKYTNEPVSIGDNVFEIKHDETITITNLPKGVEWTIEEDDYSSEGYDEPDYTVESGEIEGTEEDSCTITNNNDGNENIETGVFTDNMPYIMLMAFVMILAAAVVLKKRTVNE